MESSIDLKAKRIPKPMVSYTKIEEYFNIFTHLVGFALSVVGSIFLILRTIVLQYDALAIFAVSVYSATLVLCFAMSTVYHWMPNNSKSRRVFRRLDHCSISLLIAGTYTPFMLIGIGGVLGAVLTFVNLSLAVLLVTLNSIDVHRFRLLSIIGYLTMGWLLIAIIVPAWHNLGALAFIWLFAGGLSYTIGVVFYKLKFISFNHAIWHIFVLVGAVLMYISMFGYVV